MARSCGIRIGARRVELLVLDGSTRKPKVRTYRTGILEPDEAPDAGAFGDLVKELSKKATDKIDSEGIGLVVDSGSAVFRHLSLPFAEKAKIEEVLKFEVESKIPQWDIDDVVCDFHVVSSTPVESHLLVTAVPKRVLGERLEACSRAGLEPFDAELDATALFTAGEFAGIYAPDTAQLLVYLGDASATLVAVSGGKLLSTRAFHFELDQGGARTAATGEDGDEPAAATAASDEERRATLLERRRVHVARLRREIARTLNSVSTEHPYTAIHVCGILVDELLTEPIGGVAVEPLDPLASCEGTEEIEDRLAAVVAFGGALRRMGFVSQIRPRLRREDLSYAGTFERLELPLGVLGLLLLFYLVALTIINHQSIRIEKDKLESWVKYTHDFMLGKDPSAGEIANAALTDPPAAVRDYGLGIYDKGDSFDPDRSRYEELTYLGALVGGEIGALKEKLGAAEDASYPQSALWAVTLSLDVLDRLAKEKRIPRFAIRSVTGEYVKGSSTKPDRCRVSLDLTIWGATAVEAAGAYDALIAELRGEDWFMDELREPARSPGDDGSSLILDGLQFMVDPDVAADRYIQAPGAGAAATTGG
ncbi:MAG: hypothetical protein R3F34_13280 [Planctomycetota bacterium]